MCCNIQRRLALYKVEYNIFPRHKQNCRRSENFWLTLLGAVFLSPVAQQLEAKKACFQGEEEGFLWKGQCGLRIRAIPGPSRE